jgi:hypothetical protein
VRRQTVTAFLFTDRREVIPCSDVTIVGFAGLTDNVRVLVHPPPSKTAKPKTNVSGVFILDIF